MWNVLPSLPAVPKLKPPALIQTQPTTMLSVLQDSPPRYQNGSMALAPGLSQRALWAAGQPISYLMHHALAHPEVISLAAGFVDQRTLPVAATRAAMEHLLADSTRGRAALQYGTTAGFPKLREQVLARLQQADDHAPGVRNVDLEQVVVTAGSNELLHVLLDTLCDAGDIVICGAPSYFVFLGIAANLGVRTVGAEVDEHGLVLEAVEEQLERLEARGELHRVKAIYVVSYFDNPRSLTLADDRRAELIDIAHRWSKHHKLYVIEDAAYRELRYEGPDVPSVRSYDEDGDTVIFTETFSKSFSPGIRVGWGVLPSELVEPVLNQKGNIDFGSPNFSQHLMASVMELGLFDEHIDELRRGYRPKLAALLEAAEEHLRPIAGVDWAAPQGGLYVWLRLPETIDAGPEGELFDTARRNGMLYVPGQYCFPSEGTPVEKNTIRLSFGVQTPERICEGIAALADGLKKVVSG